jgi:hypothetical protein
MKPRTPTRPSAAPQPPPERQRSSLAATITASAATVTAVVAVLIALWDNVQTRSHNRLSVMPYVVLERTQHDSAGVARGTIEMSNEGVGPAILQRMEIRLADPTGRDTALETWSGAVPILGRYGLRVRGWMEIDSGSALGVQRSAALLRVEAEGDSGRARLQTFLDRARIRLHYNSIYGERQTATFGEWRSP